MRPDGADLFDRIMHNLPAPDAILRGSRGRAAQTLEANTHVHLPPNFSSFPSAAAAAAQARREGVGVLGISNYYGTGGYGEFAAACLAEGVFPLFGMEIIVRFEGVREASGRVPSGRIASGGVPHPPGRINDPQNPGKMYLCGKGLLPCRRGATANPTLESIIRIDRARAVGIIEKLCSHASSAGLSICLDAETISKAVAEDCKVDRGEIVLQERHIARAAALAIDACPAAERRERWRAILGTDEEVTRALDTAGAARDIAMQDVLRKRLLKSGRPCYVPEKYIDFEDAAGLVRDLGGIIAYPVLADGASQVCEFESDSRTLVANLQKLGINAVEFIPARNEAGTLAEYVEALEEEGFVMTGGTEHNTPRGAPLILSCRGGEALPRRAAELFARGARILAAHSYLRARGEKTPLGDGRADRGTLDELANLGGRVIEAFTGERGM